MLTVEYNTRGYQRVNIASKNLHSTSYHTHHQSLCYIDWSNQQYLLILYNNMLTRCILEGTMTSFCAAHSWATPTANCSRGTINSFRSGVRRTRKSKRTPKPLPISRLIILITSCGQIAIFIACKISAHNGAYL